MLKFLTMAIDPEGAPRAWGESINRTQSREIATAQLAAYRKRKTEAGDPLANAAYTFKTVKVVD